MRTNTRALVAQLRDALEGCIKWIESEHPHAGDDTHAAIDAADRWLASPPTNQCGETCERASLCATCARGIDALAAGVTDADRLDFIEQWARDSRTGVSFDWVPPCEGEPRGYRMIWWHTINGQQKTLREAIDAAMRSEGAA